MMFPRRNNYFRFRILLVLLFFFPHSTIPLPPFSQVGGMLVMGYGQNQTVIYKESPAAQGQTMFQAVTTINENGIAAAEQQRAAEENDGVNLEAFGEVNNETAFG